MNERIKQQISHFRKILNNGQYSVSVNPSPAKEDSLSKYIRTEEEAKTFMAEVKKAFKQARMAV